MAKNTKSLGIIPARFASTRFPGKPLVDIGGQTMIGRVYGQACKSRLGKVVVATDDQCIFEHVQGLGGNVVMTSSSHLSGTDRCAEVAALPEYADFEVVVNIQGDEPFIQPAQIDLATDFLFQHSSYPIATLAKRIGREEELFNPNVVKVVFDKNRRALYFSRATLPHLRNVPTAAWWKEGAFYKHIGLYAFRREALLQVAALPVGRLEKNESLEQLRWLENGFSIGVALTEIESYGIDTPADLEKIPGIITAT
jgi:3-deoxy-manno-octulosonate cytidylyltransferase (CMP-KDO synthetase)